MRILLYFGLVYNYFLYSLVKVTVYWLWCRIGIRVLGINVRNPWRASLKYGCFRFFIGFRFGLLILVVAKVFDLFFHNPSDESTHALITYLGVYLPIRWIEWTMIPTIMDPKRFPFWNSLKLSNNDGRSWKLGGIFISCLADLPIIALFGIAPHLSDPINNMQKPGFHLPKFPGLIGRIFC